LTKALYFDKVHIVMEKDKDLNWKSKETKELVDAFLSLSSREQAERFLRDLMTEGEIIEFAKRFQTAEMLSDKIPYSTIERETGFSSTTVARVSKWLSSGTGGYQEIIAKLHHHPISKLEKGLS
jgi:TrpR-related protein YerC/YecD